MREGGTIRATTWCHRRNWISRPATIAASRLPRVSLPSVIVSITAGPSSLTIPASTLPSVTTTTFRSLTF